MADTTTANTVSNTAAGVAIGNGVANSDFARSLLSASFDQILHGHFAWQLSDVITLVCSAIVIANYIQTRAERRRRERTGTQSRPD